MSKGANYTRRLKTRMGRVYTYNLLCQSLIENLFYRKHLQECKLGTLEVIKPLSIS